MEFTVRTGSFKEATADVLAVPVFENEGVADGVLKALDDATGGVIGSVVGSDEMRGKTGDTAYVHIPTGLGARRVLLVGVGKAEAFTTAGVRKMAGAAARTARKKGAKTIAFLARCGGEAAAVGQATAEGVILGLFEPDTYRTNDRENRTIEAASLIVGDEDPAGYTAGIERGRIVGDATNFARMLVNEPGNAMTPGKLAIQAANVATEFNLDIDILDEIKMSDLGMGALLGVSRGSEEEARLIVMRYTAEGADADTETLALVGKGLTFDAGGISLKPAEGMDRMKYDMSGGAAVIGAMRAIAQLKPKVNVLGIIPSSENLPDGKAMKPGDVLKSMDGKTIEILNTDAEGRLILADALAYARKLGATRIIDLATLTGAISIALGPVYVGLFSDNQEMADQILAAARRADEKMWQLPLDPEYGKLIKSDIADLKNTGGRYGGSITAAYFLKEFNGDLPWVHLDIAGTAWNSDGKAHVAKGPTGVGVRTLVEWVTRYSA